MLSKEQVKAWVEYIKLLAEMDRKQNGKNSK